MPMNSYSVRLKQVVEEFNLIVARESSDYDRIDLMVEEVMRPGLPLAGFFTHFEPLRLQVIGNAEATYLHSLTPERRAETFDQLFSYHIPALVFARNIEPMPECMQMAEKHDITILRCLESTSYVVSSLITYLKNALAPRITRHGVFVEVYGEGLLLMGESGIGKSEAAAELLKRGHRLIADDAVEIRKVAGNTLRVFARPSAAHELCPALCPFSPFGLTVSALAGSLPPHRFVDCIIRFIFIKSRGNFSFFRPQR